MRSESTKLKTPQWIGWARAHGAALARTAALLVLIAGVTVPAFRWLAPRNVGDIQILFLDDPGDAFAQPALTYLLYELNARQSRWHFDVNFDVFNPRAHVDVMEGCEGEVRVMLCHAERMAAGEPLIALTTHPLEQSHFSENRGNVSVITTDDWDAPPTVYEYLTYSIILKENHYSAGSYCGNNTFCPFDRTLNVPTDPESFFITELNSALQPEWKFQNRNTQSCSRRPDGTLECVDDHPNGFEWCVNAVAVDRNGRPVAVPALLPETEDEKRRYEAAKGRRARRLEERNAEARFGQ